MANDIPTNPNDLTPIGENPNGGVPIHSDLSPEDGGDLDPKTKAGFQTALNKKAREAQEIQRQADALKEELDTIKRQLKDKEMAEMSDEDRVRKEREDLVAENAKLRITQFALQEVQRRKLDVNDPLIEVVLDSPWAIPFVKRNLGDSPTWAEVTDVVKSKLPSYLDNLQTRNGGPKDDLTPLGSDNPVSQNGTDPERPANLTPKRTWTRKEIGEMSDETYLKHRNDILLAELDGRVV